MPFYQNMQIFLGSGVNSCPENQVLYCFSNQISPFLDCAVWSVRLRSEGWRLFTVGGQKSNTAAELDICEAALSQSGISGMRLSAEPGGN